MALERVGLGGVLTFDSGQAVSAMNVTTSAINVFVAATGKIAPQAQRAGQGVDGLAAKLRSVASGIRSMASTAMAKFGEMGSSLRNAGFALAPLTLALGFGVSKAADFEQQMRNVNSILQASPKDFDALTLKAKQLGVATQFTASEAAAGMEDLARAGFSAQEVLDGIGGVLSAAAADSIPLATAADIVAQTIRGMGLSAKDTTRVADVLALTSAKSATDITSLGESFKYAASQAKFMEIDLETTAASLGVIADAGLRGSSGGTSFTNMLIKLAKPSEAGAALLKKFNVQMTKTATGGLDVVDVVRQINDHLSKETDVVQRAKDATELFGVRGAKAYSAMALALKSGKLPQLVEQMNKAGGSAERMATERLKSLKGAVILFKSTLESFFLETAGTLLGPMQEGIKGVTEQFNNVVYVIQKLNMGVTDSDSLVKEYGSTAVAIAKGIKEGLDTVIATWKLIKDTVIGFIENVTGRASPQLIQSIAKWATILFFVGAALSPILIVIGTIITIIATVVVPLFSGLLYAVAAGAILAAGAIGVIGTAWLIVKRNGESFGETMSRVWDIIKFAILYVIENAVKPFWQVFVTKVQPVIEATKIRILMFVEEARNKFAQFFGAVIQAAIYLKPVFAAVFRFLGGVIGTWVKNTLVGLGLLLQALKPVLNLVKEIGIFIIEGVVNNIQLLIKMLVKTADLIGKGGSISKDMREFANAPRFSVDRLLAVQTVQGAESPTPGKPGEKDFWSTLGIKDPFAEIGKELTAKQASSKGMAALAGASKVQVDLTDKRKIDLSNCLTVDGRNLAVAQSRHQLEVNERAGFKATPWQRRVIVEQGAMPQLSLGGGGG